MQRPPAQYAWRAARGLPVLECDGMKALPGTTDINSDDDGTRLALIHIDSSGRQDAGDRCLFSLVKHAAPLHDKCAFTD